MNFLFISIDNSNGRDINLFLILFILDFFFLFDWINFEILLCFDISGPRLFVAFKLVDAFLLVRHYVDHLGEDGHDNVGDESSLRFCHVSAFAITKHADWQSHFLFKITLHKEFIEKQIGPIVYDAKRPSLLRDISLMYRIL